MIVEEIKAIRGRRADLRKFGITMCIALAVLAALLYWRGRGIYVYLGLLSPLFLVLGLLAPRALGPFYKGWMSLAAVLGWVMTRVILTLLFYLGVTPVGVIARLLGRRFLDVEMHDSRQSYWIPREAGDDRPGRYERQY